MYIEQIKYFFAIAQAGSISKAANNLFISQQGMSDALLRLEKELGFPLFVRQKKNLYLTKNGEEFLTYAKSFLQNYDEMLKFAVRTSNQYTKKNQEITFLIGSFVSSLLIDRICDTDLINQYNLNLYENTISDIDLAFAGNEAHLAIFCLDETQLLAFQKKSLNYADYMELIELFDDEIMFCMSKDNPLNHKADCSPRNAKLLIEFPTTYYNYFNNISSCFSTVRLSNISSHIKLMKENDAICFTTSRLYRHLYPDPDLVVQEFSPPIYVKFYLARNKNLLSNEIFTLTETIKQIIGELIQ